MAEIDRTDIMTMSGCPETFQIECFPLQSVGNESPPVTGLFLRRTMFAVPLGIIGNEVGIETFDIEVDAGDL